MKPPPAPERTPLPPRRAPGRRAGREKKPAAVGRNIFCFLAWRSTRVAVEEVTTLKGERKKNYDAGKGKKIAAS